VSKYIPKPTPTILQSLIDTRIQKKAWERSQQRLDEIEILDEFFHNDSGCFRWKHIRNAYFNDFINIFRVVDLYKKWRDQNEYLWLELINIKTDAIVGNLFFKCSKRGNDVYKHRLKQKFNFLEKLDPIYYFLDTDKHKYTSMLFVSLTVDPKKYSFNDSWMHISEELHFFETKLRQAYGKFVKFRVWEAHESGFPHCHIVYYFNNKTFKVFEQIRKKDEKQVYRVANKHNVKISNFWKMGNVDVQGVQDTHGAFSEVMKYITKNIWSTKGDLTNAMICLYRKQMYSISHCNPYKKRFQYWNKHNITNWRDQERSFMVNISKWAKKDFIGAIWGSQIYYQFYKECGELAEPETADLVRDFVHNCNIKDVVFRFVGCVSGRDVADFVPNLENDWLVCADPPPEFRYLVGINSDLFSFKEL